MTLGTNTLSDSKLMRFAVREPTDVVWARLRTREYAAALGLSHEAGWHACIVVSELVENAVKFGGGTVELRPCPEPERGVEIVVEEAGRRIPTLDMAMKTRGAKGRWLVVDRPRVPAAAGLGCGLGAAHDLADELCLEFHQDGGMRVTARKHDRRRRTTWPSR